MVSGVTAQHHQLCTPALHGAVRPTAMGVWLQGLPEASVTRSPRLRRCLNTPARPNKAPGGRTGGAQLLLYPKECTDGASEAFQYCCRNSLLLLCLHCHKRRRRVFFYLPSKLWLETAEGFWTPEQQRWVLDKSIRQRSLCSFSVFSVNNCF